VVLVTAPEERTGYELRPPREWVADHGTDTGAAAQEALEYDAWFRWVADPDEVAERDRRLEETQEAVADAIRAGDRDRFEASAALRDDAFWTMPVPEEARVQVDLATYHADDDADGWY
jgi:hypothetical protein